MNNANEMKNLLIVKCVLLVVFLIAALLGIGLDKWNPGRSIARCADACPCSNCAIDFSCKDGCSGGTEVPKSSVACRTPSNAARAMYVISLCSLLAAAGAGFF